MEVGDAWQMPLARLLTSLDDLDLYRDNFLGKEFRRILRMVLRCYVWKIDDALFRVISGPGD